MSEAVAKILRLERGVTLRQRLLSLQDGLVLSVIVVGLAFAAVVTLVRLRTIAIPAWAMVIGAISLATVTALTHWLFTRSAEAEAAFRIDETLNLDDRIATSRLIIRRGGPSNALEGALIEDSALHLGDRRASAVIPFRTRRWYALSMFSFIAVGVALMIPTRLVPVNETLAAERSDIESAGDRLEQAATDIEKALPPGSETASLAKEQAEVGRGFRRSGATRAEALRRLSALEERIRRRHDDLASTRADEIVSLADRRLGSALSTSNRQRAKIETDESGGTKLAETETKAGERKRAATKEASVTTPSDAGESRESSQEAVATSGEAGLRRPPSSRRDQPNVDPATTAERRQPGAKKRTHETARGKGSRTGDPSEAESTSSGPRGAPNAEKAGETSQRPDDQTSGDPKHGGGLAGDQSASERKESGQRSSELPAGALDALKAVPSSLAEQAGKAIPKVSEELLKKAAELRANQLNESDIAKLRKAAELLSRDLSVIGQSKELQKALEEMARQIRPDQIEQVARELGNNEKLKQELGAAARLLSENHQAKETVAGLTGQFARMQDQRHRPDNDQQSAGQSDLRSQQRRPSDQGPQSNRASAGRAPEKLDTATDRQLAGQGRKSSLNGKLQPGSGGEYLYLQSKAGIGAARAPYSSAYPQYRREVERSVQRSEVPPSLRSVVRKYFDAINPDSKR